jgi:hypothetical protein
MSPWPPPAIPPVLDELIVEDAQNSGEPAWGVVRKACRHFEFLLNLLRVLPAITIFATSSRIMMK